MKTPTMVIPAVVVVLAILTVSAFAQPFGPTSLSSHRFISPLEGEQEVPQRDTLAAGLAQFTLSADGTQLHWILIVANIENVVAAHIHVGAAGVNGPVVLFLYGPAAAGGGRFDGVLSTGTATSANLVGPLAGMPLSALVQQMIAGNTYTNVHTDDGVAPANTGPGDFPGGEIRGQIFEAGPSPGGRMVPV